MSKNGFHRQKAQVIETAYKRIEEVRRAMLAKLQTSALTRQHADQLQLQPLLAAQTAALKLPVARAGFKLPYFDMRGKPTKFFRFRYLEYGVNKGFAKLVEDQLKQLRYAQPAKTAPELYLPPLVDWRALAADPTQTIVVTEGELKAACATVHQLPTIGLGGVWSFKSAEQHAPLLPMFQEFNWKERPVIVCFDSDAVSNLQVLRAENALCRELLRLGALPAVARMPVIAVGVKCGMDDYIAARGAEELWDVVLARAEQWKPAQELFQLNEEVLYVEDPGLVLRTDTLQKLAVRAFIDHAFATRIYYEEVVTAKGVSMQEKSAAREWIRWPQRARVHKLTYEPGMARVTPTNCINMWTGWGCQPVQGDCKPWHQLLEFLFQGIDSKHRTWFEQWLAYPLQRPGTKLYTAAVLWGVHHGTGKSLVGYSMMPIYGGNATEIGDKELQGSFNEWAEHKQFVMGDEITGGDKRQIADRMKSMITQRQLRLNPKYVPSYTVPDCVNYYFTSNHPDAFFLEDTDRRFFIHEVRGRPLERAFYDSYAKWLHEKDGAAKLFWHLLHNVDCSNFNPQEHAPNTESKFEMIALGRSDLGTWVATLRDNPDQVIKVAGKAVDFKLFTSDELRLLYDPDSKKNITANGVAREMRRAGFVRANHGAPVQTTLIGQQRLWAVRDIRTVLDMDAKQLAKQYDCERQGIKIYVEAGKKF